ncbi:MAG: peptidase S16 [Marinicaulis sp.]|nr:peptidase S16 [Marinicaulis sp.]
MPTPHATRHPIQDIPTCPIFPLAGAILLPGAQLPLNIFEPRYLQMVDDALADARIIGMIQPSAIGPETEPISLFNVGCAGRITTFSETSDGRYQIVLSGLHRFSIRDEISSELPYRTIQADWLAFSVDSQTDNSGEAVERDAFLDAVGEYLHSAGLHADEDTVSNASIASLTASLTMGAPFSPSEKQALLEAKTIADRASCLMALMKMSGDDDPEHPIQ